jgi:hypothetical protein
MKSTTDIIDEHAQPPLRRRLGRLLHDAHYADFAVTRIRIAGIDLDDDEIAGLTRCRVLVAHLNADTLAEAADAGMLRPEHRRNLRVLLRFVDSGRLQLRAAGVGAWVPDFSVFHGDADALILGAHYFGRTYPAVGPSFTCITRETAAVRTAARRFEDLWHEGRDVLPAIRGTLELALLAAMPPSSTEAATGGRSTVTAGALSVRAGPPGAGDDA